ncbi:MAG: hypothetical protein ABSF47_00360 [Minisyncoccia bacterium]|jgi:hypothetical protein
MISEADGDFDNAPNFKFNDDKVKFNTNWVSNANDNYGSASGFVSKSLLNEGGIPAKIAGILPIFLWWI